MKYVFFGTPRFAEIILDRLLTGNIPPVALIANPDRPVGRKKIMTSPLTKQRALQGDASFIDILQPESLNEEFIKRLQALEADFFVVAAYGKILPETVLTIPRLGTIGVHPSLLPLYRGSSPIQSAILNGEIETGVSLYLMDTKMDHGAVIKQEKISLTPEVNYLDLQEKLAELSGELLIKILPDFAAQKIKPFIQKNELATYTKKFTSEDGFIVPADLETALKGDALKGKLILRKIKALNPEPGVWTTQNGKRLKLLDAELKEEVFRLTRTQEEGGKPVEAK